jgi:hypothetical protein
MPWETYTREGTRSLFGPSLHQWAGRIVSESDRGFRVHDYLEHSIAGAGGEGRTAAEGEEGEE